VVIDCKGKLGAAFGSYGWSGEAVPMIEDRLRGLKFRVAVPGLRIKLIPTEEEIAQSRAFGRDLAEELAGLRRGRVIDFAELSRS
jgi:flavorubredoxin